MTADPNQTAAVESLTADIPIALNEVCGETAPNQCPTSCSTQVACSATDCGSISDGCGGIIDCAYTNCPQTVCGEKAPNKCPPACAAKMTAAGTKLRLDLRRLRWNRQLRHQQQCPANSCGNSRSQSMSAVRAAPRLSCNLPAIKTAESYRTAAVGSSTATATSAPRALCGVFVPNQCPSSCNAKIDCQSAGNKDCGTISDGCGGTVDCGTCTAPQCCGCGSTGSPGSPNKCGGGTSTRQRSAPNVSRGPTRMSLR